MEHKITLVPNEGMTFDGQPISFGMARAQAEAILGPAEAVRSRRCYYLDSELALDFDADGGLNFIECLGGVDGELRPEIFGLPAFETDADELFALLSERNGPDIDDSEAEYGYALRKLSVGLYREITPADVDAMLREMGDMKLESLGGVDVDEEMKKAHHWATIGIGRENYYA